MHLMCFHWKSLKKQSGMTIRFFCQTTVQCHLMWFCAGCLILQCRSTFCTRMESWPYWNQWNSCVFQKSQDFSSYISAMQIILCSCSTNMFLYLKLGQKKKYGYGSSPVQNKTIVCVKKISKYVNSKMITWKVSYMPVIHEGCLFFMAVINISVYFFFQTTSTTVIHGVNSF